jgi:hypothetical protein
MAIIFFRTPKNAVLAETCLDNCKAIDYVAKVSTTKLSKAFSQNLSLLAKNPNTTSYISFTVFYRTFDITRISYHGKVMYFSSNDCSIDPHVFCIIFSF